MNRRMSPLALIGSLPIRFYRLVFSPWVGHGCRFHPTCSAYAMEALRKHGGIKGTALTIRRVIRCNPWGGSGVDNVPD
jgi:putative membrane protein insertion efficiency factor